MFAYHSQATISFKKTRESRQRATDITNRQNGQASAFQKWRALPCALLVWPGDSPAQNHRFLFLFLQIVDNVNQYISVSDTNCTISWIWGKHSLIYSWPKNAHFQIQSLFQWEDRSILSMAHPVFRRLQSSGHAEHPFSDCFLGNGIPFYI